MKPGPLVSIIIPTYNRAHLIGETLDSVLAQTYTHWECIVVDDGSSDNTSELLKTYCDTDARFKYVQRPDTHKPGGNGARNYGLKKAFGEFVIFFDSDDLMTPNHLEIKMNALQNTDFDYVITKTKYFDRLDMYMEDKYKNIKTHLSAENYILQNINWLTPDVCMKTKLVKTLYFNEEMQSGQEYNYFSKLVLQSVNAIFVEALVTLRREHPTSIRSGLKTKYQRYESYFKGLWFTYLDIQKQANSATKQFLMMRCAEVTLRYKSLFGVSKVRFYTALFKQLGFKTIYHLLFMVMIKLFGKGYWFQSQFYKSLKKT